MRRLSVLVLILLSGYFSQAQEINDANAERRSVSGFSKIEVSSGILLYLTQGNAEAVAVSATTPEYRSYIKTEVSNGTLKIYFDRNFLKQMRDRGDKKLKAYVSFKELSSLEATSGSLVKGQNQLNVSSLKIEATSGAQVNVNVKAASLDVDQNSGSIINLSGVSSTMKVEGSSGSIFNGYDLATENCTAETSSGAIIHVTVNKELSAEASSGGIVSYKGSGMIRDLHTSSGGNVSKK